MAERRSHGEGSKPRHRKDGRWEVKVSLGTNPDGSRRRQTAYGKTKRLCQQAATKIIRDYEDGKLADPDGVTLSDYLTRWLQHKRFEVEPRTLDNYARDIEIYLLPHLGDQLLKGPRGLTITKVKDFQRTLAQERGAYTANRAKSLLGNVLGNAIEEGLLLVNVAKPVKALKHEKKRVEIWTAEEIPRALAAARITRWYTMIYFALVTGMRHGEITGLSRASVTFYPDSQLRPDEDHGEVRVDRAVTMSGRKKVLSTPKTPYSIRSIGFSEETKEVLLKQLETIALEKELAPGYRTNDLLFPTGTGSIIDESNTITALDRIVARANPRMLAWLRARAQELKAEGLGTVTARERARAELAAQPALRLSLQDVKRITFHDLRHTFASMMIADGVDAVRLARLLGHNDPGFTMRTYAHFFERQNRPAMSPLSRLLGVTGGQTGGQDEDEGEDKEERDAA